MEIKFNIEQEAYALINEGVKADFLTVKSNKVALKNASVEADVYITAFTEGAAIEITMDENSKFEGSIYAHGEVNAPEGFEVLEWDGSSLPIIEEVAA